jgi:NADH-quinone oxidoreductase subunit E
MKEVRMPEIDMDKAQAIITGYVGKEGEVITLLQEIQEEFNFLPPEVLRIIPQHLEVPLSRIYSIATFYAAFSLEPRGKHTVRVCTGTACHVRGGQRVLEALEKELEIKTGETTDDLNMSLDAVRCLGSCCLAPVVKVDDEVYANMKQTKVGEIVKKYD